MTPQEKAKELFDKYYDETPNEAWFNEPVGISKSYNAKGLSKKCALIAVELRLEGTFNFTSIEYGEDSLEYWQQVKEEINKL